MGVGAAAVVGLGAAFWDDVFGAARSAASSPRTGYGPRRAANEHGLRLPEGFRSRLIARGDEAVPGTDYRWHLASDGMATFPAGRRRLDARVELRDARGRRVRRALRRARPDRAPPTGSSRAPRRTARAAGRRGAPGSPARSSGGLVWECDPAGERQGGAASGDGLVQARGGRRGPARQARVPDRGPDGRPLLPVHARALARPERGPPRGGDRGPRREGQVDRGARPLRAARGHAQAGARQHALQARRGDLARRRDRLHLDDRRQPRVRLRHPPRADRGDLRRPGPRATRR